jgi:hypothetical protein
MWAWLLTTKLGRYVVAGLAIAAALGLAALKLISTGRQQERARQQSDTLEAIKARRSSDEKVDGLGPDDVRDGISKWMRDGKK